jgi:monoamine oxidase
VFTNVNADAYLYNESTGMTKPERYRTAKADVYGYVSELLAKATDKGALDGELTADEKERLVAFLEDWGELGDKLTYEGGERRGYTTVPAAAGTPGVLLGGVPTASKVFASGVGRYFSFEFGFDQAMLMFQPVGGMDQIPRALARAVGAHRVRTGAVVSRITDTTGGVSVTYTQGGRTKVVDADYCVAALPPNILAKVPHNLGSGVQSALEAITPHPHLAPVIRLPQRARHSHRLLQLRRRRGHLRQAQPQGARGAGGGRGREDLPREVPHRTRLLLLPPLAPDAAPRSRLARHARRPDDVRYKPLNEPTGRVYFAGDWLSYTDAWQHGAFASARKAVTALHTRVLSS